MYLHAFYCDWVNSMPINQELTGRTQINNQYIANGESMFRLVERLTIFKLHFSIYLISNITISRISVSSLF